MASKRKRKAQVPRSMHHPSQSSVAVPKDLKSEIKEAQDGRCWLCNHKPDDTDTTRSLNVCHLFPQALGKRFTVSSIIFFFRLQLIFLQFESQHKYGRTQLVNIHDRANLVVLCTLCHFAFDNDEWCFLPEQMTIWIQEVQANPRKILEYNARRDVSFQRLLLQPDPYSKAHRDIHYRAAFSERPVQKWAGEAGVTVLRNFGIFGLSRDNMDENVRKAVDTFKELQGIWSTSRSPCPIASCRICYYPDEDEDEEIDYGDDNEGDGGDAEIEGDDEDGGGVDENDDNDVGSKQVKKRNQKSPQQVRYNSRARPPHSLRRATTHNMGKVLRKARTSKERGWMTSAPYDKSIPFTHRYGYTWANTTSNDLMAMWQASRQPLGNV